MESPDTVHDPDPSQVETPETPAGVPGEETQPRPEPIEPQPDQGDDEDSDE